MNARVSALPRFSCTSAMGGSGTAARMTARCTRTALPPPKLPHRGLCSSYLTDAHNHLPPKSLPGHSRSALQRFVKVKQLTQDSTSAGKFTGSPPSSLFTPTANILLPNPNSSLARGRVRALKGNIALFASLTIQILLTAASVLSHSARRSETDRACCSCNTACTSHSQSTFCISTAFPVSRASCSSRR